MQIIIVLIVREKLSIVIHMMRLKIRDIINIQMPAPILELIQMATSMISSLRTENDYDQNGEIKGFNLA